MKIISYQYILCKFSFKNVQQYFHIFILAEPRERPKLVLAPRTKPIENVPAKESVPSAAIFGNAKPVDTTQREKEIEEKLAREQSEVKTDSKDKRAHHSTDRKRSVSSRKYK